VVSGSDRVRPRKLRLRLGGDPADDEYPDKPPRMRWATYNRQTRLSSAGAAANATGVSLLTSAPEAKRLGLPHEVVPNTEVIAAPFHTTRQWKASTR
jgi:hypothetical protein